MHSRNAPPAVVDVDVDVDDEDEDDELALETASADCDVCVAVVSEGRRSTVGFLCSSSTSTSKLALRKLPDAEPERTRAAAAAAAARVGVIGPQLASLHSDVTETRKPAAREPPAALDIHALRVELCSGSALLSSSCGCGTPSSGVRASVGLMTVVGLTAAGDTAEGDTTKYELASDDEVADAA